MRFLIAFVALLGYASASAIHPLAYGVNAGDAQAAAIDATVAAQDHARAVHEGQARAAEAAVQYNTEAVRQVAETNRDLHESAYWNGVAATQDAVASAQSHSAAASGVAAAVRAAHVSAPGALAYAGPYAGLGYAAPYAGLGYAGLGYAGHGYAGHGLAAPYAANLGLAAPYGYGINGLGAYGLGAHAW